MKNNILLISIFLINLLALPFLNYLDISFTKWCILTMSLFLFRILKISISKYLEKLYLILIFLSFTLGRIYDLYDKIIWYDTLVHFISGILGFLFGIYIIKKYTKNIYIKIIFSIALNTFIDVLWEFIELFCDYTFNTNMMKIQETGILDTMKDLSVASISALMLGIIYLYKNKKI